MDYKRLNVRLPEDLYQNVSYWSKRTGLSMNEYILEAIDKQIAYENRD